MKENNLAEKQQLFKNITLDECILMKNKIKGLELESEILKKSNNKAELKLEAVISDQNKNWRRKT